MKKIDQQHSFIDRIQRQEEWDEKETSWEPCGELSEKEAFEIYLNNYRQSLINSLCESFEACVVLLGREAFEKLAYQYLLETPSISPDRSRYGENFSEFLGQSEYHSEIPFLRDLACLEWCIKELFLSEKKTMEIEVSFPVDQIWLSLLYDQSEEIIDNGHKRLRLIREGEKIFFA